MANTTATVATPINACGASTLQLLSPKILTARPLAHSEAAGLSTVIELAASDEPKNQAVQLFEPAWAAAA